jgi:hypothetical protein
MNPGGAAAQVALPCNAYCVCTPPLHSVPPVQNPLRGVFLPVAINEVAINELVTL